ncbi:MAG: efflux RND transporter periplasmic adaptor subunit [Candidatus Jorgensenbacteria bacterium]|nr:efflux RND transporter periplasmic adaptor subunit [Candidatus Jorgensenbacteria bacterium]
MQHQAHTSAHPKRASKKWIWISVLVVILAGAGAVLAFRGGMERLEELTVTRGTVVEAVSVTGRVKPASSVNLAFERSGKVSRVFVKVGDRVNARVTLVELDASDLRAELREAEAQVAGERANLEELRRGARPEEVAVKVAELAKADQDLANYYTAALVTVEDAYAKADDAVRSKTDQLFTNDDTSTPALTFTVSDSQVQVDVVDLRRRASIELGVWNAELRDVRASTTPSAVGTLLTKSEAHLALVRDFLARALDAVNASTGLSATTADTYKTSIGTGRTNVAAATTAISSVAQNLAAQALVIVKTRLELTLTKAGTAAEVLLAQDAKVLQTEARRDAAAAALAKTVITAPFAGLVTKQDADVGEIVGANETLVSLIAERSLEIEAFIPEVDVGKVEVGDMASVTLDAYGQRAPFVVRVARIEPAETVVEGVATYKTIFHFLVPESGATEDDAQSIVKSGMTANIEIETARRGNVLVVPFRTLQGKNGGWIVFILDKDGTPVDRAVTIGLRGTDGTVEVTEGLREGDRVVATPPR